MERTVRFRKLNFVTIGPILLISLFFVQSIVSAEQNWKTLAADKAKMVKGGITDILVVKAEIVSLNQEQGSVAIKFDGPINMADNIKGTRIPSGTTVEIQLLLEAVAHNPKRLKPGSVVNLYYGHYPPESLPNFPSWQIVGKKGMYLLPSKALKGLMRDPEGAGRFNFVPLALQTIKF